MPFAVLPFTGHCDSNNVERRKHEKVLVKCNNIFLKKISSPVKITRTQHEGMVLQFAKNTSVLMTENDTFHIVDINLHSLNVSLWIRHAWREQIKFMTNRYNFTLFLKVITWHQNTLNSTHESSRLFFILIYVISKIIHKKGN